MCGLTPLQIFLGCISFLSILEVKTQSFGCIPGEHNQCEKVRNSPARRREREQDSVCASFAPVWVGNNT